VIRTQRLILLAICLFVSGAAGLIYEVVWSRYLALFVGSSGIAHLVILSTFMGGLAIGARLFGPRADAAKRPLLVYVMLEVGIALAGILYPTAFEPLRALFIEAARALGGGGGAIAIAASIVAGASILPAAILMGGTTPVLLRGTGIGDKELGRGIAAYYFINSLGAVFGALAAGLWLVPQLGLAESSRAAAGFNILAASLSLAVMLMSSSTNRESQDAHDVAASEPMFSAKEIRAAAIVATISGFVSFIYEVAWIRLLSLVLGSATYAFPLMLGAFILGLSLGSLALAMRRRDDGWFRILGWSQLAIGISALLSLCFYEYLPLMANHIRMGVVQAPENYPLYLTLLFALCIGAMIVPTFCMGIALPAATRVVTKAAADSGRSIGRLFALNTMGTVVGAIVGGAILLPALGIRHTIEGACVLSVLIGLSVLRASDEGNDKLRARTMFSAVCFLVAGGLTYAVFSPELDTRLLTAGMYREKRRIPSLEAAIRGVQTREMLYYADGIDATIAVTTNPPAEPGGEPIIALIINGKVDASSHHDMQTQLMVGHLPMMIHPDPKEVLVVGLGAGVTVGATLIGGVGHVDCIELIPEVVEASRFFSAYNGGAHTDPRFKVFVQDAKTYLLMSEKKYDMIINEPTNLWVSGVPGLFTKEHISAARKCLKDDGIYLEWLHTYEMQDKSLWPLISTFQEVFPYSTVFNVGGDLIFIGSPSPFKPDFDKMEKYVAQHDVAQQLERFSIRGLLPILSMQVVAKTSTPGPLVPPREAISDFYPKLDYECAEAFFLDATASSAALIDRRYDSPIRADLWVNQWTPSTPTPEKVFADFAAVIPRYLATYGNIEDAWLELWLKTIPTSAEARLRRMRGEASSGLATAEKLASAEFANSLEAAYMRSSILYMDYVKLRSFINLPDQKPLRAAAAHLASFNSADRSWALTIAGDCDMDAGEWNAALLKYNEAIAALRPNEPALTPYVGLEALHLRIAEAYHQLGDIEASHKSLEQIPESENTSDVPTPREMLECRLANFQTQ
jgi:spermidine synthase